MIKCIGINKLTNRNIFFISLNNFNNFPSIQKDKGSYFGLFLGYDNIFKDNQLFSEWTKKMIARGLVYVDFWGKKCEDVHDLFDKILMKISINHNENTENVILSNWHEKKTLEKALWHFLNVSFPANDYSLKCNREIVMIVGDDKLFSKVEGYLKKQIK